MCVCECAFVREREFSWRVAVFILVIEFEERSLSVPEWAGGDGSVGCRKATLTLIIFTA